METVCEEPEKAETISVPEEILNATLYQERAKIREVFVDEGNFSKQCVVLDPEAEVQIHLSKNDWDFCNGIARQDFKELREQVNPVHVFLCAALPRLVGNAAPQHLEAPGPRVDYEGEWCSRGSSAKGAIRNRPNG